MGGAARVVNDHARAFMEFADVSEVVFNSSEELGFEGENVTSLGVEGGGNVFAKMANFLRRVARLRRLKDVRHIQVCVSHLEGAHYVDLLSRRGEKNVLCVHGSILHNDEIRGLGGWARKRLLIPFLYRRADAIVPVSNRLEPELRALKIPRSKIRTINNFFDLPTIKADASEPLGEADARYFQDGIPVILVAARLHQHKNLASLIDVVADLSHRRAVRLLILGDGPLRNELVNRSRSSGATTYDDWTGDGETTSTICFAGARSNPFPFYGKASLFASSSNIEGFPLSLCEAMSCRLPVIATDCPGGVREILAPEMAPDSAAASRPTRTRFGMLMPMLLGDGAGHALWVETLDQLIGNPAEMRMLSNAALGRVSDFSEEKILPRWRALFDELLEGTEERAAPSAGVNRI
jgi:glycosyltransferase involved in cell wall biosynthesis